MKDFHVHEHYSGDASEATVPAYLEAAEKLGIDEICFTTHLIIAGQYTRYSIQPRLISKYIEEIEEAQASTKIKLRVGLEVDYFPGEERHIASILNEYSFDFVLGSLHFPRGFNVGSGDGFSAFSAGRKMEDVLCDFYSLWKDAVESRLFDVMAHPDYFRRAICQLGLPLPSFEEYGTKVLEAIDSLKSCGVGFEINSSGFKHNIDDCYPVRGFLKAAQKAGIDTVTIGSDAHGVDQLGMKLDVAVNKLREVGYSYFSVFSGRKAQRMSLNKLRLLE
jgi:histidinol-phosphatase (PHP family)